MSFLAIIESMQNSYLSNLPFQHVSLAKIYHSLGLRGGEQLFNTIVNFLGRGSQFRPNYDESWTVLEEVSGGGTIEVSCIAHDLLLHKLTPSSMI
jgi:hypothetical protein